MVSCLASVWRKFYHGWAMLTVYSPGANKNFLACPDSIPQPEVSHDKIMHANSLTCSTSVSPCSLRSSCNSMLLHNPSSFKRCSQLNAHYVLNRFAFRRWLVSSYYILLTFFWLWCPSSWYKWILFPWIFQCCSDSSTPPSDDEYRSSRNIAISLFRRYRNYVDRGGGDNLKVHSVVDFDPSFSCEVSMLSS